MVNFTLLSVVLLLSLTLMLLVLPVVLPPLPPPPPYLMLVPVVIFILLMLIAFVPSGFNAIVVSYVVVISNLENTTGYRSFVVIFQDIVGLASTSLLRGACQDLGLARTAPVSSVPVCCLLQRTLPAPCLVTLGPAPAPAAPPSWNSPRWTLVSWSLPHGAGLRPPPFPGSAPPPPPRHSCRLQQKRVQNLAVRLSGSHPQFHRSPLMTIPPRATAYTCPNNGRG